MSDSSINAFPIQIPEEKAGSLGIIIRKEENPVSSKDESGETVSDWPELKLGQVIQSIVEKIREKEKLKKGIYPNVDLKDDRARKALERIAWESDWTFLSFRIDYFEERGVIDESAIEWNVNVGFILPRQHSRYDFNCSLYQHYSAAEYSLYGKIENRDQLDSDTAAAKKVRLLIDDLMWLGEHPNSTNPNLEVNP